LIAPSSTGYQIHWCICYAMPLITVSSRLPREKAQGKDPEGSILLQAYHEGNHIVIVVEDDGPG